MSKSISIKNIIARIIRNTGNLPSNQYDSILEWIPEAMRLMDSKYQLVTLSKELKITDNSTMLPCDYYSLLAVEYKGNRLRYGGDITSYKNRTTLASKGGSGVFFTEDDPENIDRNTLLNAGTILKQDPRESSTADYYKIQMDCIQTSFKEGTIKIHYLAIPTDEEGFPLIPDNENYKQALYWYCLTMLIGAGYEHKIFKYTDCEQRFELYAGRALGEITYPSIDRIERLRQSFVRMIPAQHFYNDFFINSEQVQEINNI